MNPIPASRTTTATPSGAWLQPEDWALSSAHAELSRLLLAIQDSAPELRSTARALYEKAVSQLAEKLIESPAVFEAAYDPSADYVDTWFPTVKLLYATAKATPAGANFRFSDAWLEQLAGSTLSWEGRIFSVCDNTIPRRLKLLWLGSVLDELMKYTPSFQALPLELDFLSEPSVAEDPACQKMLALWFARVAINPNISTSYRRDLLALLPSPGGDPWRRPRDILQMHFPEALPQIRDHSHLRAPLLDAYAMAVGSSAFYEIPAEGPRVYHEGAAWIITNNWLAENAAADMQALNDTIGIYYEQTEAASIWVWGLEKIAENVKSRPGVFESSHSVDHEKGVDTVFSVASALMLCAAAKSDEAFRFDVAWVTRMGDSLSGHDEGAMILFGMSDDRLPLATRLSWLRQSLNFIADEITQNNIEASEYCQWFDQATDCAGPYQEMIGLWLALLVARRDIDLLRLMDIALYALNDMHAAMMLPEDILGRYSPKALPSWSAIRGLDLGLNDAWLMVTMGGVDTPATTLPGLG